MAQWCFAGVEDVEIGLHDGKIYFTPKGTGRVYRFTDAAAGVSAFEIFVGQPVGVTNQTYPINYGAGTVQEAWGTGNDNLTFDSYGNLYVLQDGGRDHICLMGPLYEQAESEVLGVPATLDSDQGKYLLHGIAHQRSAFKTPTVRNAARTAPYRHNGVYQTLDEVIDFYDRSGGRGLAVPTQTLSADRLHLTPAEKAALIAFIGALNDEPLAAKTPGQPLGLR